MNTNAHSKAPSSSPSTKWGPAVTGGRNGYQILPDALLRNQKRLGLTCTDLVVLVNILMHWWEQAPKRLPHPRPEQIASRIGTTPRTVQRSINRLTKAGLLKWLPAEQTKQGLRVRKFDIQGLVRALTDLAGEVEDLEAGDLWVPEEVAV